MSSKLSLILYDQKRVPRLYHVSRAWLRPLLWITPIAVTVPTVIALYIGWQNHQLQKERQMINPERMELLEKENSRLDALAKQSSKQVEELTTKVALGTKFSTNLPSLLLTPLGMKDVRRKKLIAVEDLGWSTEGSVHKINFKLVNLEERRQRGHLHVFLSTNRRVVSYPTHREGLWKKVNFKEGESYFISRFKPIDIEFSLHDVTGPVELLVVAFGQSGDLIFAKRYIDGGERAYEL